MFLKICSLSSLAPPVTGAVFAVSSALSLSISMSIIKTLSSDISTSLVVFMRTSFGLLFFFPFLIKNYKQLFKTSKLLIHLLRITISVSAMLCTYYTYRHLPLGFATSLGMTGPLFTTLISIIFLQEHIDKYKWLLLIIGYLGAILIIKPHNFTLDFAIITSLLANILAGISIVLVKILSKHDSTITIMGYSTIGVCLAAAALNYNGWQIIELQDIIKLAIIAFLGFCAQYFSITAVKHTSPSFTAPFEYIRLLFSFFIGFFVFNEFPDDYTILGSLIIVGATYAITVRKNSI